MSYGRLVKGYAALVRRLFEDKAIFERLRNHMASIRDPLSRVVVLPSDDPGYMWRFLLHGLVLGGPRRWYVAEAFHPDIVEAALEREEVRPWAEAAETAEAAARASA